MAKLKSKKSILKRFKITGTGKILRRPTGQDHYLAKKSGKKIRKLKRWINISRQEEKKIRKVLHLALPPQQ